MLLINCASAQKHAPLSLPPSQSYLSLPPPPHLTHRPHWLKWTNASWGMSGGRDGDVVATREEEKPLQSCGQGVSSMLCS